MINIVCNELLTTYNVMENLGSMKRAKSFLKTIITDSNVNSLKKYEIVESWGNKKYNKKGDKNND